MSVARDQLESARGRSSTVDATLRAIEARHRRSVVACSRPPSASGCSSSSCRTSFVWVAGFGVATSASGKTPGGRGTRRGHRRPDRPLARRLRQAQHRRADHRARRRALRVGIGAPGAGQDPRRRHVLVWGDRRATQGERDQGGRAADRARDDRDAPVRARRLAARRVLRGRGVRNRALHGGAVRAVARRVVVAPAHARRAALVGAAPGAALRRRRRRDPRTS